MLATVRRVIPDIARAGAPTYLARIVAIFRRHLRRLRQRDELARMSDRELSDLGLAAADRRWIARSAFWKRYPFADETDRMCR